MLVKKKVIKNNKKVSKIILTIIKKLTKQYKGKVNAIDNIMLYRSNYDENKEDLDLQKSNR